MEKRIGAALIVVEDKSVVEPLNQLISKNSHLILGRQGLPLSDRSISVISLVLEGTTDEIGAFTGPVGRLKGVTVKSILVPLAPNRVIP
ncbi:TM1266 family iron-only hydrogenase system putative regulator [Alistipes sp. ZOR0009]|jgi:putative iron-only hydrogenase system regulator|uniref:TM1266 family iron-only hydrogenase system putative regulator n=1 Tax=Alistipes sp. ZOR0009 TaxID=1339253 RepID=UPI00064652A8|nr:TM1266 family iron-only hydrogenase system putative regulator [Alistipes sp. ZOR0009]